MRPRSARGTRRDPAWRVVAAVGVLLTCVSGFGFYSLAVYVFALTDGGAFDLATVSRGSSLYLLTTGLGGVAVASLLARLDARAVLASGAVVMAAGLVLLGRAREPEQLYAAYVLLGLGQSGAGLVPGTTVVARWFVQRRGTALALASTGLSVGGIAVAPLVSVALRDSSLQAVTTGAAVVFVVLCLLATAAVVPDPALRGLAPDGGTAGDAPHESDGATRAQALRTGAFWAVTAAQTLAVLAQVGGLTHLYSVVAERSPASVAGAALSCVAFGSFAGRFLGGLVLARASTSAFFRLLLVVQAGSLAVLAVGDGAPVLLGASALFGFTIGNVLLVHPLLLGELFGLRDFARVLSTSGLVTTAGATGGPLLVGLLRSSTGSYASGYLAAGAASLVGAVVLHLAARSWASSSPPTFAPALTEEVPVVETASSGEHGVVVRPGA